MMTEEIGLNKFLEKHGISAIETDCAEHIIQTAGNAPSILLFLHSILTESLFVTFIVNEKDIQEATIPKKSPVFFAPFFALNS